ILMTWSRATTKRYTAGQGLLPLLVLGGYPCASTRTRSASSPATNTLPVASPCRKPPATGRTVHYVYDRLYPFIFVVWTKPCQFCAGRRKVYLLRDATTTYGLDLVGHLIVD